MSLLNTSQLYERISLSFIQHIQQTKVDFPYTLDFLGLYLTPVFVISSVCLLYLHLLIYLILHLKLCSLNVLCQLTKSIVTLLYSVLDFSVKFFAALINLLLHRVHFVNHLAVKCIQLRCLVIYLTHQVYSCVSLVLFNLLKGLL